MTCDRGVEDGINLLMDTPMKKYPGHTHASFSVPNVDRARLYLESCGIAISGERKPPGRLVEECLVINEHVYNLCWWFQHRSAKNQHVFIYIDKNTVIAVRTSSTLQTPSTSISRNFFPFYPNSVYTSKHIIL